MKKIRIRYIRKFGYYYLQHRTWYGWWMYASWTKDMGYATVHYYYSNEDKDELLTEVLRDYFQVGAKFVIIIEHPTILHYKANE